MAPFYKEKVSLSTLAWHMAPSYLSSLITITPSQPTPDLCLQAFAQDFPYAHNGISPSMPGQLILGLQLSTEMSGSLRNHLLSQHQISDPPCILPL